MSRVERGMEFFIAYSLAIVSAATASLYGLLSAVGVYGVAKGAGLCLVAFLGCHGPAWILKAWHRVGWPGAVFGTLVTAVCFTMTLWGGLGTNATGGAALRAERAKALEASTDAQAEVKRITAKLAGMAPYAPTTQDVVTAARGAVRAAEAAEAAECQDGRGKNCRARTAAAEAARATLQATLTNAAATAEAAALTHEAEAIRARIASAPAAVEADPQASAFSTLTGISLATSAALYAAYASLAFELGAMFALLIAYSGPRAERSAPKVRRMVAGVALVKHERRAASDKDVARFMLACLPRARGEEAEINTVYARFCRWCDDEDLRPLDKSGFATAIKAWCARGKIGVIRRGDKIYCADVKLAS